jgi:hypothetical protein
MTTGARFGAVMALGAALALAACEAPERESDGLEPYAESVPAEAMGEDAAAELPPEEVAPEPEEDDGVTPPPADPEAADSVRPESETLFY